MGGRRGLELEGLLPLACASSAAFLAKLRRRRARRRCVAHSGAREPLGGHQEGSEIRRRKSNRCKHAYI